MLVRELIPELDNEQFQQLLSDISDTALLELLETASKSESIVRLSAPASMTLGSASEPFMFHMLFTNLIGHERERVRQTVQNYAHADMQHFDALTEQLMVELTRRLLNFYMRPLVSHIKKISAQGLLRGETSEERYEDYCRRWYEDFQDDFYTSYPLLRHVHTTIVEQFYTAISEIFERVQAHESDIRKLLSATDADPLKLESLVLAGDHHNGGRTGCMLVFQQGTVVYKPRSVEGEQAYYNIVQKLAAHGAPAMRAARVVVGDGYGFMEFIEREETDFSSKGFLESSGRLAALLYALQGKDMHEENIIPSADGPIPVDLETILHPIYIKAESNIEIPQGSAFLRQLDGISTSALLPTRLRRSDPSQGYIDIGFIQGEQGNNPFKGMKVENPFRDDAVVQLVRKSAHESNGISSKTTAETLERQHDIQANRAHAFVNGFVKMYCWICEHRHKVMEIIRIECTGIVLRAVLQPTMYYGQLMNMLGSPEALASRDIFRTIMFRTAAFGNKRSFALIAAEVSDLWKLDVPFFVHQTDHPEVTSLDGCVVGTGIKNGALDETLEHITHMDEEDLDDQVNQIWSAFISPYPSNTITNAPTEAWTGRGDLQKEYDFSIKLAKYLTSRLRPGISNRDSWTWVSPTPGSRQHTDAWDTTLLALDFYTGSSGVALGVAHAFQVLKKEDYAEAVYRVFNPIIDVIISDENSPLVLEKVRDAAFMGEPGIAFALAGAAECLNDPRLKEAAAVLGNRVAGRLAQAEHPSPDYLTGQVGAAALMLGYDLADDREALLGVLDRHAQDIIDGRLEEEWWSHSGFAHGISASIFALSRWNQQIPSSERAQHAVKILLDRLREFDNGESWESQISGQGSRGGVWCHGTAGISLALAAVQAWMPELSTRADLERAVHHALHEGTGRNLTYCHGDMGTLDILEWVVNHVPDLPDAEKIRDILKNGYSTSLLQETLEDKSVRYSLTPSYMVGTSGVLSWLTRRIGGTRLYTPIIPDSTEA